MAGSVDMNADSARLPRVRFWEVTTETSLAVLRLHQQYLAVIVGKIRPLNNLGDERPKFERPDFITFVRHHIAQNENQRVT